jgi:prepilin-type N-terminal cleavage/methylation domain-containing protein
MKRKDTSGGFTLIEILVVIGIIAILAAVVIVALNPARQFAQARDAQRSSNVNTILNAISQRMADARGLWTASGSCPASLPSTATVVGSGSGNLNLASCLVPTYVSTMVVDPSRGTTASTGYTVNRDSNGRVTVNAPYAEINIPITVTR